MEEVFKHESKRKYLYVLTFFCLAVVFFYVYTSREVNERSVVVTLPVTADVVVETVTKPKVLRVKNRTQYIRIWNTFWGDDTFEFGRGSEPFRKHNCSVQDCYMTYDKDYMKIDKYDALLFHAPEFNPGSSRDYPSARSPNQKYVFFNMESPITRPLHANFDNFYNVTMTYRTDSDILVIYFSFSDLRTNAVVSPSSNPQWIKKTVLPESLQRHKKLLKTKNKPVAWFVSNCKSGNDRRDRALGIRSHLNLDIYGGCGELKCPRENMDACFNLLKTDYFFYLSFENSNCEDYATEKLATAMLNDVVPIFYGGINMTKFLPPDSYIDASSMTTEELAEKMKYLIANPGEYLEYFWWKDFYRIDTRFTSPFNTFCKLCEYLHDDTLPPKIYEKFNNWWTQYDGRPACKIDFS